MRLKFWKRFKMPELPEDIERLVLEYTALLFPEMTLQLIMISRSVKRWIEPLLYRNVILKEINMARQFIHTLNRRPREFFLTYVRGLCLPYSVTNEEATQILKACANVSALSFWVFADQVMDPTLDAICQLPLTVLGMRLEAFNGTLLEEPEISKMPYRNITHLDIYDDKSVWLSWTWEGWDAFTALTHLTFWDAFHSWEHWSNETQAYDSPLRFLQLCKSLRLCLFYLYRLPAHEPSFPDKRIVLLESHTDRHWDWERRLVTNQNDHGTAEEFLKQRQD
ncbi:hypothetical protein BDN72DRAFT_955630 [Pluteus cervinus]|uniref:Uncharacterized protein n=1 Tax=Pluteus cervinus TaxID=181527 RepID=A0ACD3BC93_9AGAR|nr:hypothetical protein BDN72DRAFT_955630 [Pluteus cervinus]